MLLYDDHSSINGRARSFDYVRFALAHEGRDCNREAHYLAKHACTLKPGRHVWLGYPPVWLSSFNNIPTFLSKKKSNV
jgi:hypothetical protein